MTSPEERRPTFDERRLTWRDDARARRYDHRYRSLSGRLSNRRVLASYEAAMRRHPPAGWVLDCPTGTGRLMPALTRAGAPVLGGDIAPAMMKVARDHYPVGTAVRGYVAMDIENLPFRDGGLGAVCVARLTQHCDGAERVRILRELKRVTSGPIFVSYYHCYTFKYASRWLRKKLGFRKRDPQGVSLAEVRDDARAVGLEIAEVKWVFPLLSTAWLVCFRSPH
jgi:ubiquinone/menaquinone biosynthesis C-methylase UbiE